jgi:hypothetical protein
MIGSAGHHCWVMIDDLKADIIIGLSSLTQD